MSSVWVSGGFDDLRFADFRFLEEAAKLGSVRAMLWPDDALAGRDGKPPKFPESERQYLLESIRYVQDVTVGQDPQFAKGENAIWAIRQADDTPAIRQLAAAGGVECRVIPESVLNQLPPAPATPTNPPARGKKVIVTGCFDWFHSGHVRFFEECSELGDLYVTVGSDDNIRLLKGDGHPLFPALQRRSIAGSVRFVKEALIASGMGWMDAEPDIEKIRPDIYAVNEDGDKPEKRAFCQKHGIEYRVLKRLPKEGLPRRASTSLRGF